MDEHEWTKYFNVDIMDSEGDLELDIKNGKVSIVTVEDESLLEKVIV